jgi:hypothetical protein
MDSMRIYVHIIMCCKFSVGGNLANWNFKVKRQILQQTLKFRVGRGISAFFILKNYDMPHIRRGSIVIQGRR